jgi:hypothetical protein
MPTGIQALRDMRTSRRKNRLQDLEWFDALYRVYLAAFIGGGVIMFLSGLVGDTALTDTEFADMTSALPHVVGLVAALVVFLGARSGAHGGPIAIEEAEVRHVLMAPIERSRALRHPAMQRLRTFVFVGAIVGGVANQLLARRIEDAPSSMMSFVVYGVIAGGLIGALFIITALLVHSVGMKQPLATTLSGALFVWQAGITFSDTDVPGPFDCVGSISMWWERVSALDLVGVGVVVALGIVAVSRVGSLSLEALARRSALVSQMKFAVTLQDLRTVVLLRRQLSQEHMRTSPWMRLPRSLRIDIVVARGVRSVLRFPVRRLFRMALLSGAGAYAMVVAFNGTTPAVVAAGMLFFIVGLDLVEPLSQEIDQPDRTDSFPRERGWLLTKHLIVPAVSTLPFIIIGVLVAYIARPDTSTLGFGLLVGISASAGAIAGAALNAVNGAPDPAGSATSGLALPPEMSGMGTVIRGAFPPCITTVACLPLLAFRESASTASEFANGLRAIGGVAIVVTLVGGWIRQRDAIRAWFSTASQQAAQKSSSSQGTPS